MDFITCSDCGFTADEAYFNIEEFEDSVELEAECCECGNWTTL